MKKEVQKEVKSFEEYESEIKAIEKQALVEGILAVL